MNIILIGFMGVGKSQVGHKLAEKLKMHFVDTDDLIEKAEEMSISEIFQKKGEPFFRELETKIIKTLQDYDNFVISTGGGMVMREDNVKMLKELGPLVLLWSSPDVIYERVKEEFHRPLIEEDKRKNIDDLLAKRTPVYEKIANVKVDTSTMSVDNSVEEIIKYVQNKG